MLDDHTKLELIEEFSCRRCSIVSTHCRLSEQLDKARNPDTPSGTNKKRIRELQKSVQRLQEVMEAQDFELDLGDMPMKLDRAIGPASKQIMYSTPPNLLVIHLSRSSYTDGAYGYSAKNNCQIVFPEYLDLDPYTTSYSLSDNVNRPISVHQRASSERSRPPQNLYRICSLVVHFGSHSSGHYVCYRRRPEITKKTPDKAPLLNDWLRVSDDEVDISSTDEMLRANPYLLFYERIDQVTGRRHDHKGRKPAIIESWMITGLQENDI